MDNGIEKILEDLRIQAAKAYKILDKIEKQNNISRLFLGKRLSTLGK